MRLSRALRVRRGDVVALVGGGGKTTVMFRLAVELQEAGLRVVTSTTTRIFAHQMTGAPHTILSQDAPLVLASGHADVIIVEADGARMLPFKAPDTHEPVIPQCSSIVVSMVGIQALGACLEDSSIHRPERIAELAGCKLGGPITPSIIVRVLSHPQGGLKGTPTGARVVPMVNRIASDTHLINARELARQLLTNKELDEVVLGGVEPRCPVIEVQGRSVAVILAAGASRRFGRPKLDLAWGDTTVVGAVADRALRSQAFADVLIVVGAAPEQVRKALGNRPLRIVANPDWQSGQSSSVRSGIEALAPNIGSAVFFLGDQPVIEPAVIGALHQLHRTTLAKAVVPIYQGQRGNPVLFDRSAFDDLCSLSGDTGGRALLNRYGDAVKSVEIKSPAPFDIDTPEDYKRHRTSER